MIDTTKPCHTGNTAVYKHPTGGTLFMGGWSNGAFFTKKTHVIDLTGTEHKYLDVPFAFDKESQEFFKYIDKEYAGWLSLPFEDYKVPKIKSRKQWQGIANTIKKLLAKGDDVLVACLAGHGRSGTFCAIVGYLLDSDNPEWASPVEHLRNIHCEDTVDTYGQEEYVYKILGLNIKITRTYFSDSDYAAMYRGHSSGVTYSPCSICGTQSMNTNFYGMCLTCESKYKHAPVLENITEHDIKNQIIHTCSEQNCMGIWKPSLCNHYVHNKVIFDGLCESCNKTQEAYEKKAESEDTHAPCAVCESRSIYAKLYGICWHCSVELQETGQIDSVHNSITDPYRVIPHTCAHPELCNGIVVADKCRHVVHDHEVQDGKCEVCQKKEVKE